MRLKSREAMCSLPHLATRVFASPCDDDDGNALAATFPGIRATQVSSAGRAQTCSRILRVSGAGRERPALRAPHS
jgi:hypothetical protein